MRRLFFVLAFCLPALTAQERCPWLNPATAGGVLGGDVTHVDLKLAKGGETGSCDFIRTEGSATKELFIEVEKMNRASFQAQCQSQTSPLKAIGNDAFACAFTGDAGRLAEQIVSRVRDLMFVVRISTSGQDTVASLREKARKIAEQVAGALF